MSALLLHARPTSNLLHAEAPAGEFNVIKALYTLVDEDGNTLVDPSSNILVSDWDDLGLYLLHAGPTSTLIHAEAS